jgi:nitrite reductase (NADH) small subunit
MNTEWIDIGHLGDIPMRGSRLVSTPQGNIAVFKAADSEAFALWDKCPHKGGPLSQGIVHGHAVTCPLHNWVISLETGEAKAPDKGCAHKVPLKIVDQRIFISVNSVDHKAA